MNQTFTVVNSLHLSQYDDQATLGPDADHEEPLPAGRGRPLAAPNPRHNLYACIVDADVRHNYATLAVHFRRKAPPAKLIPRQFGGARLQQAKSSRQFHTPTGTGPPNADPLASSSSSSLTPMGVDQVDELTKLAFLRDNRLTFPMKSFWIPANGTPAGPFLSDFELPSELNSQLPNAPVALSMIIIFVFSTLLALVYLTLKSYQALTSFNLDEELAAEGGVGTEEAAGEQQVTAGMDGGGKQLVACNLGSPSPLGWHCQCQQGGDQFLDPCSSQSNASDFSAAVPFSFFTSIAPANFPPEEIRTASLGPGDELQRAGHCPCGQLQCLRAASYRGLADCAACDQTNAAQTGPIPATTRAPPGDQQQLGDDQLPLDTVADDGHQNTTAATNSTLGLLLISNKPSKFINITDTGRLLKNEPATSV